MGPARVVYQWSLKRSQRDNKTINAQIARAEKATTGKAPVTRTRFLKAIALATVVLVGFWLVLGLAD
jgi:hypothetical protein